MKKIIGKRPLLINDCWVYTDAQKYGIYSGTNLNQAIDANATTIVLVLKLPDPNWTEPGKLKIENEIIRYENRAFGANIITLTNVTRGVDNTNKVPHALNTFVGYLYDPEDIIKSTVAHESGHAVDITGDVTNNSLMTEELKAGAFNYSNDFRHAGAVACSTQDFAVK